MRTSASQRLREIAESDPDRSAIETRTAGWTYAQLDREVDRLASWLTERPGGSEVVALRFLATAALITSSLAVSRSGRVCVLIDPTAPLERVQLVLADLATAAGPPLLLVDSPADRDALPGSVLLEDALARGGTARVTAAAERDVDTVQSIVYTSGSTGAPVGLCVDGHQRAATSSWVQTFGTFRDRVRVGVVAAGSMGQAAEFPHAVVTHGGTMVVHDVLTDGLQGIPGWLRRERVEAVGLVPTLLRFLQGLLDAETGPDGVLPDLRTVAVWGEGSDWDDLARLARHLPPDGLLANAYATTETGMVAALTVRPGDVGAVGERGGRVLAGSPLPGVEVRVLDEDGRVVPAGAQGEVCVRSGHLAHGYWGHPERSRDVFGTDPDGARTCRTGDWGWVAADGQLHVVGRLDDVVKVSGHRVALGELEAAARALPGVGGAAAVARQDAHGAARLHLHVVADGSGPLEPRWVRAGLARVLPPHVLPDTVDLLAALPTLPSGKVDRAALPEPAAAAPREPAPDDDLASRVAELFAEALSVGSVGVHEDFFELGGDSLRAGRVVALLQTRLGHYVPASLVIEAPTAHALAAALQVGDGCSVLVPVRTTGAGTPLFVVSGAGGEVFFARAIARHLDPAGPVYGLQPPPLVGPEPFAASVLEVAHRYVHELRRVWPDGPYRLFGYSMGGLVAFEMATLLQDQGAEVELLALGDTSAPEATVSHWVVAREHEAAVRAGRSAGARLAEHVGHRRAQLTRRLSGAERITEQWRRFDTGDQPGPDIRADAYRRVYGALVAGHRVRTKFRGELLVVVATEEPTAADDGWGVHVDGRVRRFEVESRHDDLVGEPAVAAVAAALSAPG